MNEKTHFRKAFDSPYLSSADIVEPIVLTITCVRLQGDKTKKTTDVFNTAYFAEKEIRPGEELKPMILNAGNSRTLAKLSGSKFIEDWQNIKVTIYVDEKVRFGKVFVEGLRISAEAPKMANPCSQDQILEIKDEIKELNGDEGKFCALLKVACLEDLNMDTIKHAKQLLEQKRAAAK